jgi:hypothetical protein
MSHTLRRVCAWCKAETGTVPTSSDDPYAVTHGICPACEERFFVPAARSARAVAIEELLERLEAPVFVIEDDVAVGANRAARAIVGKELPQILDHRGGEVFECVHAYEPGGCGSTEHCGGCTIRRAVLETHDTGRPVIRRIAAPAGRPEARFYVTTEKRGGAVLLRIDPVGR